jgi:two-component system sensor histidine kinase BaeS
MTDPAIPGAAPGALRGAAAGHETTSRSGTLGLRLALAFLGVALAAVALLAGLTAVFASADVSNLATQQRTDLARAVAFAAGVAYDKNDTWTNAGLSLVLDQAARTGLAVQILDQGGHVVDQSGNFRTVSGPQESPPITVRGQRVGTAVVRITGSGIGAADRGLKTALLRAIAGAAGLAALLALLTGLAVARRITRPVTRLIAATRAMAGGDRTARVGEIRTAGELRELAAAFDQMAGNLDRQEQIRRNLVADVAHELRTPIAILQAGHEALLDGVA